MQVCTVMPFTAATGVFVVDDWVTTWGTAPQLTEPDNMPPPPGLSGQTLRQLLRVSIGGRRIRVQLSNAFGCDPVQVRAAQVALSAGQGVIQPGSSRALFFQSQPGVTIPPGEAAWSDPLDFTFEALGRLAVTMYFGNVSQTLNGHPGSRTTSYIQAGDAVSEIEFGEAYTTDHWYILTRIDAAADKKSRAIVTLGDSITDGRGSTTNGDDRWPDNLSRRLRTDQVLKNVAVVNMGIGGNAVHSGGLGPTALRRFDRDVLDVAGVRWLILLHGVNDVGGSGQQKAEDTAAKMISAYESMIAQAHGKKIRVYGVPLLPFGGSHYDHFEHEAARRLINQWIRTSGAFDAVIDMEAAVRDPAHPNKLLPAYDTSDHLHLNQAGLKKMAEAIDLELFAK
jgi:lysophospholipase L1-like esterase